MNPEVTAYISTKDREHATLPLAVVSIALQTYKPKKLIIYDDGKHLDLREDPVWKGIFQLLLAKDIAWTVSFGEGKGQVLNHQRAIKEVETPWLFRIDDDNILEPDVLEKLVSNITDKTGAVGGVVLHPYQQIQNLPDWFTYNKIEDCELPTYQNIQWYRHPDRKVKSVDHLYSTFIYRKEASKHGYCMELTPVGNREETLFTYEMKRSGWDLLVDPTAVTWHSRYKSGGIRGDSHTRWAFEHDSQIFLNRLKDYGVKLTKLVVLNNGLGDHIVFKKVLQKLKLKHKRIVIACCYPDVFKDEDVTLISIAQANCNLDDYNLYKFMWDRDWKNTLEVAYEAMYLD